MQLVPNEFGFQKQRILLSGTWYNADSTPGGKCQLEFTNNSIRLHADRSGSKY